MSNWEYWQKQQDEQLFPDIEWQTPQTKKLRGKLLIIGGNAQGFELPIKSATTAMEAGAGEVQILLPDSLKKFFAGPDMPIVFANSTPAGSFAKGDPRLKDYVSWADLVLVAGDLGHNSETSLFFEELISFSMPLTLSKDAFYYANHHAAKVISRADTILTVSFSQLQQLLKNSGATKPLSSDMSLVELVEYLHEHTNQNPSAIMCYWQGNMVVAMGGQVITTKLELEDEVWQQQYSSKAAVFAMQHPKQILEALATSVLAEGND